MSVSNVDQLVARAVKSGAALERPPADQPYGRSAVIRDPFGHRWLVSSPLAAGSGEPTRSGQSRGRPSDIVYASLWVPDADRAAAFFADVLGWTYQTAGTSTGRQVVGQSLPHGLSGGHERSTLLLCFAVDDLDAALTRVRDAGGETGQPADRPHGRTADCVDDQGVPFAVVEGPASGHRSGSNGERHGDLAYVTMEVADSQRTRAFYSAVVGWRFSPARVEDGWSVDEVVPMTGLRGGLAQATTVPMYRVDDIYDAVARVRAHGGTSTDPAQESYGLAAQCVDDQGTRFYLGRL
jgi:predicted enzyme related to lactoylglutathione lyase